MLFSAAGHASLNRAPHVFLPAELAIIIPTFNERDNIAALVTRISEALEGVRWEIIFVDDHSPDGTAEVVREVGRSNPRVRGILRLGRRGLSGACVEGLLATHARYLAVMDADLQHDPHLLPLMLAELSADRADLVIGSRYVCGGSVGTFDAARHLGSRISTYLTRRATGVDVADPMSGFFMLRREAIDRYAPQLAVEGFKILFDILASARGALRVIELPYTFGQRWAGASKLDVRNILDFFGLLVSKVSRGFIPLRFPAFVLVGASGMLVHLAALKCLLVTGATFVQAHMAAAAVAMTSNFVVNNAITYRDLRLRGAAMLRGLALFHLICGAGAVSNVGVASWIYANEPVWWIAGAVGSLIGAVWNYTLSNRVLWRP